MNDTPQILPADLALEMDKVAAVIATARRLMADGRTIDLSTLEGRIDGLCARIRQTPPASRDGVVRAMENMVRALDELEAAIRTRVGGGESGGVARRRVLNAYARQPVPYGVDK
ncbi:MAG: hypothetical protein RBS99_15895 [Rhodospirillales bacterium]|jgi:hypothetical protein|nr:hypothetical protein [Rhodospirillales bacterium]